MGLGGCHTDFLGVFRWDHYGRAVARLYLPGMQLNIFEMRLKICMPNSVSIYQPIYDFCLSLISAYHSSSIYDS